MNYFSQIYCILKYGTAYRVLVRVQVAAAAVNLKSREEAWIKTINIDAPVQDFVKSAKGADQCVVVVVNGHGFICEFSLKKLQR